MTKGKRDPRSRDSREPIGLLKELISEYFEILCGRAKEDAKLGDWLKMLEYYRKAVPDESAQKKLWQDLERIRRKVLAPRKNGKDQVNTGAKRVKRKR